MAIHCRLKGWEMLTSLLFDMLVTTGLTGRGIWALKYIELLYRIIIIWDCFRKKGPNACFFKISIFLYSRSLKCPLHIASYALRIGVSVIKL